MIVIILPKDDNLYPVLVILLVTTMLPYIQGPVIKINTVYSAEHAFIHHQVWSTNSKNILLFTTILNS